ncbi:MAG: prephenate dehydratase domain-containing protein [Oscillospiraceae bacterium]|nr:prephenate dehydratase domain-containing protein [Oscillospiraceae bacterium]
MEELKQLRQEIDRIDRQMVELFRQRMAVTRRVGQYKLERGLPVLDEARERQVLEEKGRLAGEELRVSAITLFQTIMALSRRQQRDLMGEHSAHPSLPFHGKESPAPRERVEHPRVVYQGVPGAYSEQACINVFGPGVDARGLEQFEDNFKALKEGRADYAVLPIENSSTGGIRQIYDLLSQYECYLVGETTVRVEHCLMAPEGADLTTITHVYSHEQGLFQCEQYLAAHPNWHPVPQADTAGSARMVAACGDLTKAAICSQRAAEIYGLKILARGINHNSRNTTRFVVVSPVPELHEGANKVSTMFVLPHEAGSLNQVLTVLAVHGLNMVKLESRPIPEHSWEYLFFMEFTGSMEQQETLDAIHELIQSTGDFRVLGCFPSDLKQE